MVFRPTLLDALEEKKDREAPSLIAGDTLFSYREMIGRAKHIGRALVRCGIKKGDRVLLSMSRTADSICAMLGILYAGGVYVPVDARWPEERLSYVRKETESVLLLDDGICREFLGSNPKDAVLPAISREDTAAIVYTSGSTGQPKGSVIFHKTIQLLDPLVKEDPPFKNSKVHLSLVNLTYILALITCSVAFNAGAALLFATEEELASPFLLARSMRRHQVGVFFITPSVFLRLMEFPVLKEPFYRLQFLGLAGEAVTPDAASRIQDAISGKLMIHYGSTEVMQCASGNWNGEEEICLSQPAEGVTLYLFDEDGREALLPGEEGEVCIGGPGADSGYYLNRPELTDEKYVVHPGYGRLFHTGDFGRRTKDGSITLVGRKDGMVKLNGQRIEVEEIEAAFEAYPGILRAAACIQSVAGKDALCVFYSAETDIPERELRVYLGGVLPVYMIPAFIRKLDNMPENASGKLNRGCLPQIQPRRVNVRQPSAAVLTPVHNTELSLLARAAASVKAQTYDGGRISWIIGVHNMDPSYAEEVRRLFGKIDGVTVLVLKEPLKKLGAIRNYLLDHVNSDYLFWLDADDELMPECIRQGIQFMETTHADMVQLQVNEIAGENAWVISRRANIRETKPAVYKKGDPRIGNCFSGGGIDVWSWGYRTDFLKKNRICFDTSEHGSLCDGMFVVKALSHAERVARLTGEAHYLYYFLPGSDMQKRSAGEQVYQSCLSLIYYLERTEEEKEDCLDLNDWRWSVLPLLLAVFTNPSVGKEKKEELHAKMRPWISALRAIDPEELFQGRPETALPDVILHLFPDEGKEKSRPVFKHLLLEDLPWTEETQLKLQIQEAAESRNYHLIPHETNPFRAKFSATAASEPAFVNLSPAESEAKKRELIRSYRKAEEMRGFKPGEIPLRITQFRTAETTADILFTWDARYISDQSVYWLKKSWTSLPGYCPAEAPSVIRAIRKAVNGEEVEAVYPVTKMTEGYLKQGPGTYPTIICWEADAHIAPEEIQKRLKEMGKMHQALRSVVVTTKKGDAFQVVLKLPRTEFFHADLRDEKEQKAFFTALADKDLSEDTRLGQKLSLRVGWIRISEETSILYLCAPHLIIDGVSFSLLAMELLGRRAIRDDTLLWHHHLWRWFKKDRTVSIQYWNRLLGDRWEMTSLPQREDSKATAAFRPFYAAGGRKLYQEAVSLCSARHITMATLMHYALGKALMELLNIPEVLFLTVGKGRSAELSSLIGMLMDSFPVRMRAEDTPEDLERQIHTSREHAWIWNLSDKDFLKGHGENILHLDVMNIDIPGQTPKRRADLPPMTGEMLRAKLMTDIQNQNPLSCRLIALVDDQLTFTGIYDENRHTPQLIRRLQTGLIRSLRALVKRQG